MAANELSDENIRALLSFICSGQDTRSIRPLHSVRFFWLSAVWVADWVAIRLHGPAIRHQKTICICFVCYGLSVLSIWTAVKCHCDRPVTFRYVWGSVSILVIPTSFHSAPHLPRQCDQTLCCVQTRDWYLRLFSCLDPSMIQTFYQDNRPHIGPISLRHWMINGSSLEPAHQSTESEWLRSSVGSQPDETKTVSKL